jgi:uncharacterized membrane protein YfcA
MTYIILGALAIGLTLGLLGSGGSILTVPILVYLVGHDDKVAVAESLGIVGGIALAGALPYARARQVNWRSVLLFGLPGMAGTYGGAWLAKWVAGEVQLVVFGCVMLLAAWMMFRPPKRRAADNDEGETHRQAAWKTAGEGVSVGVLTGFVGVGGGFLIVPALVLLGRLPMRLAVGTSLVVIALNSFSGFFKYLDVLDTLHLAVNWETIGTFVAVGVLGSLAGRAISGRIDQASLRRGFAGFLLVMGIFVLTMEGRTVLAKRATHAVASENTDTVAVFEEAVP